jgi:hypothetical protein
MSDKKAELYGTLIKQLYARGVHVVRDIQPSNKLKYLRLRGQRNEILVAPGVTSAGNSFCVIVVQEWKPAEE